MALSEKTAEKLSRERARRVAKAEADSGYKEGARRWNGKPCLIKVTFYPRTKWHIGVGEDYQELTEEIWRQTTEAPPIKL